ncbi:MAG TPA: serine/threonine-protein kinase [Polyangiaceae bacterium]|nr:serine/threonine-protein kinase [Polyangiaceae bacterium]
MPEPGDLIGGKYRIVRLIGDGGMGSVFEARHEGLRVEVALKFLHEDLAGRPGLADRFLQEARVAATIRSPHVAHVTDVDVGPGGLPYLVMELLSGESLQQRMDRDRKLLPAIAVDFALQVASGLEAAHAIGVVHRDLKPDNVFITPGTGGPLLKLIDFGIAKLYEGQKGLTRAGMVMGTPEYMPPEQLYAASDVDGRADVYALGVILFEMLSGRRPADGDDAQAIVGKVLAGDVLSLGGLEPSLPPGLVELVQRAIAADRNARLGSAHELRAALAHFAGELSPAGILAAREAPLQPTAAAAPKTLPPEQRDAFGKGSTAEAPALAQVLAGGAPGMTSVGPPLVVPRAPEARPVRRSSGIAWIIVPLLLIAGGAGAAGYVVWSGQNAPLPPPPPLDDTPVTPPANAFTAEGPSTSLVPTVTSAPTAPPITPPTHVEHPGTPTSTPQPPGVPTVTTPQPETRDAGTFPLPLPSTFPPITIPSGIPTTLPTVLPTTFPTLFPGLPAPPPPATTPGNPPTTVPGTTPGTTPTVVKGIPKKK